MITKQRLAIAWVTSQTYSRNGEAIPGDVYCIFFADILPKWDYIVLIKMGEIFIVWLTNQGKSARKLIDTVGCEVSSVAN